MRNFIAIPLPDAVKNRVKEAVQRLAPAAVDVTWCTKSQFHLTLAFLGETAPSILPHLSEGLMRLCAEVRPFTCRAYGYGFFGSKRNPKVVWAGVDPAPKLLELQEAVAMELSRFGFKIEVKAFRPHVTLGRCKERARNYPLIQAMEAEEQVDFGSWSVTGLTLFESRLSPRGAIYSVLARFPFGG
jgi:2'-5' RNA ligase